MFGLCSNERLELYQCFIRMVMFGKLLTASEIWQFISTTITTTTTTTTTITTATLLF